MKTKTMLMATVVALWAGVAAAAVDADALIADLQRQGYTWIEVKRGPTQIKVEAVKGSTKIETVYDTATGAVLDQETGIATQREQDRTGVQVQDRGEDFEDADTSVDDDDSNRDGDDSPDDSGDDSNDDDGGDRDDDDSDDDRDDDRDDDHGGDRDDDDRDDD